MNKALILILILGAGLGNRLRPLTDRLPKPLVQLFHEPVLLDGDGGLKNIAAWMGGDSLLVHNGDILSTLPLDKLIAAQRTPSHGKSRPDIGTVMVVP